jgi:spore germination cell wall hydrolase CwlJ-like protein
MAFNIYHEARNESMLGQIAVGQVVMNRVWDNRFPDTVCEVVTEAVTYKGTKKPVLHKCQFSWYCDGAKDDVNKDSKAWRYSLEYASIVLSGRIVLDITEGATHYHATYVRPSWAKTKTRTTRIDRHIFYRWEK